jgi:hypothetical protein
VAATVDPTRSTPAICIDGAVLAVLVDVESLVAVGGASIPSASHTIPMLADAPIMRTNSGWNPTQPRFQTAITAMNAKSAREVREERRKQRKRCMVRGT